MFILLFCFITSIYNILFEHMIVIVDSDSNELIIGAEVYSFLREECFSKTNIEGTVMITSQEPNDTFFQIQATGYKHLKINLSQLSRLDTIKLFSLNTAMTLGSDSFHDMELENFYRKCQSDHLSTYYNEYVYGRWISNWGSFISENSQDELMMVGMILNIEKDTMLVQDYGFNGFQTHTLYHIQIKNDTIFGKEKDRLDFEFWRGQLQTKNIKKQYIQIPLCNLRNECHEYFLNPSNRIGYRKSQKPNQTWQSIKETVTNYTSPMNKKNIKFEKVKN